MPLIEAFASLIAPVLNQSLILRVRRNHGMEHATIHMLNRQNITLSGRASTGGFVLYGDVPTAKIETAAYEALNRFARGQKQWAIHPNCGTNLVTTGFLTTLVGVFSFTRSSRKDAWERFPFALLATLVTLVFSPAVGTSIQRYITTTGDMGELEIVQIKRSEYSVPFGRGKMVMHWVYTRKG